MSKHKYNSKDNFYKIIYKSDKGWYKEDWKLFLIYLFVKFIGLFSSSFEDKFMSEYFNGVGEYLVVPDRKFWSQRDDDTIEAVVRHELVHMRDYKRCPIWFILTYIFLPLPIFITGRGMHWELRGYVQNMIVEYERTGKIEDSTIEWIIDEFSGWMYFKMFPFRKFLRKKLHLIRKGIYKGKISGENPDVGIQTLFS